MVVKTIRKITNFFGFDTLSFLFGIFEANTQILLDKKISLLSPELQKLVLEEDEKMHYGDSELIEMASQNVVRGFSIDRIQFIQECVGGKAQHIGYPKKLNTLVPAKVVKKYNKEDQVT